MPNLLKELEVIDGLTSYLIYVYDESAHNKIGDLNSLQIAGSNVVQAINNAVEALNTNIGDLTALELGGNSSVEGINRVLNSINSKIGDLSSLDIASDTVVGGINNVLNALRNLIGDLSNLEVGGENVVDAINNNTHALNGNIGDLTALELGGNNLVQGVNNVVNEFNTRWNTKKNVSQFYNKKILIIGDSNSHEVAGVTNWVTVLRQLLPNTQIDNISENGALFMGAGGQAKYYYDNINTHYDYIIVACGTNDCYHQGDIGTVDLGITNSWDNFGSALSSFYNAVNNRDVTANVIFITPVKNVGMALDGVTRMTPLDVYRCSIIRACSLFGWTLVDAGHCAPNLQPYNSANKTKWMSDGTHMSEDYAPIFANYVLNTILSGGDSISGKGIQSTIILSSKVASGLSATILGLFNSDGSITIDVSVNSVSVGAGIGLLVASGLPTYARPTYDVYGVCTTGLTADGICVLKANGEIQIFPTVTQDTGFHCTFVVTNSQIATSYQTII